MRLQDTRLYNTTGGYSIIRSKDGARQNAGNITGGRLDVWAQGVGGCSMHAWGGQVLGAQQGRCLDVHAAIQ